jgi:hypothetical protein
VLVIMYCIHIHEIQMFNRFALLEAFNAEELEVLNILVQFHDECPEWMNESVFDMVQEKVRDAFAEVNCNITAQALIDQSV